MTEMTAEQRALCAVLIEARNKANVSQRELAKRINRVQSIVGHIELGERQVTVLEFVEIARALELDPTKLLAKVIKTANL